MSQFYTDLGALLRGVVIAAPLAHLVLDYIAHPLRVDSCRPGLWVGQYTHGLVGSNASGEYAYSCSIWFTKKAGLTYYSCHDACEPTFTEGWRCPLPTTRRKLTSRHAHHLDEMISYNQWSDGNDDSRLPMQALFNRLEICTKEQLIKRMASVRRGCPIPRAVKEAPDEETFAFVQGEWADDNVLVWHDLEAIKRELGEVARLLSVQFPFIK